VEHIVRDYLIARWGDETAEDIKPLDIQRWLKSLHCEKQLAWTTISKMRGVMSRIYKVGILHERVSNNPVQHVETRSTSNYRVIVITPEQTLAILRGNRPPGFGDPGAALVGHPVGGGKNSRLKTLGKGQGRPNKNGRG